VHELVRGVGGRQTREGRCSSSSPAPPRPPAPVRAAELSSAVLRAPTSGWSTRATRQGSAPPSRSSSSPPMFVRRGLASSLVRSASPGPRAASTSRAPARPVQRTTRGRTSSGAGASSSSTRARVVLDEYGVERRPLPPLGLDGKVKEQRAPVSLALPPSSSADSLPLAQLSLATTTRPSRSSAPFAVVLPRQSRKGQPWSTATTLSSKLRSPSRQSRRSARPRSRRRSARTSPTTRTPCFSSRSGPSSRCVFSCSAASPRATALTPCRSLAVVLRAGQVGRQAARHQADEQVVRQRRQQGAAPVLRLPALPARQARVGARRGGPQGRHRRGVQGGRRRLAHHGAQGHARRHARHRRRRGVRRPRPVQLCPRARRRRRLERARRDRVGLPRHLDGRVVHEGQQALDAARRHPPRAAQGGRRRRAPARLQARRAHPRASRGRAPPRGHHALRDVDRRCPVLIDGRRLAQLGRRRRPPVVPREHAPDDAAAAHEGQARRPGDRHADGRDDAQVARGAREPAGRSAREPARRRQADRDSGRASSSRRTALCVHLFLPVHLFSPL